MIRTRTIKDENGQPVTIAERLVGYWSRKHYEREQHENEAFLSGLDSMIAFPDNLKDKAKKVEKFLKKEQLDKETGKRDAAVAWGPHLGSPPQRGAVALGATEG